MKQLYVKNNVKHIVKPLGYNNGIFNINVHYIPKFSGFNGYTIECMEEDCSICKIYNWLIDNNMYNYLRDKFRQNNSHLNIKKNKLFILPLYVLYNKYWYLNYIRLFESDVVNFYNFLNSNNMFDIGDVTNSNTMIISKNNNILTFNKSSVEFILDYLQVKSDYNKFINYLSDYSNFNVVFDISLIKVIVNNFIIFLKNLVKVSK